MKLMLLGIVALMAMMVSVKGTQAGETDQCPDRLVNLHGKPYMCHNDGICPQGSTCQDSKTWSVCCPVDCPADVDVFRYDGAVVNCGTGADEPTDCPYGYTCSNPGKSWAVCCRTPVAKCLEPHKNSKTGEEVGCGPLGPFCPQGYRCQEEWSVCCKETCPFSQMSLGGVELVCGRGRHRDSCKKGYKCANYGDDKWPACCPEICENPLRDVTCNPDKQNCPIQGYKCLKPATGTPVCCNRCSNNLLWSDCTKPDSCIATCENPSAGKNCKESCTGESGCMCPDNMVLHCGRCIQESECPQPCDPGSGQVFTCNGRNCVQTCDDIQSVCPTDNQQKCECPDTKPFLMEDDSGRRKCVSEYGCRGFNEIYTLDEEKEKITLDKEKNFQI